MKDFARLFTSLDQTTSTTAKVEALVEYLCRVPPADAAWAIYLLLGNKPKRAVTSTQLRSWAAEASGLPDWLIAECYDAVGDLAETIALVLPPPASQHEAGLAEWVEHVLLPLGSQPEADRKRVVLDAWNHADATGRLLVNKLLTGGFRVGMSRGLVVRAVARWSGLPEAMISHRLMGHWRPTADFVAQLCSPNPADTDLSRPFPFFLASPLEDPAEKLGDPTDWLAEWKWDGIRAQLIHRGGQRFIWSRGEELVTDRYPELHPALDALPDGTVLDGELLPWKADRPLPFSFLQQRISRKTISRKLLTEIPVIVMAYDLLELGGADWRSRPLLERRSRLEELIASTKDDRLKVSPRLRFESWDELAGLRGGSRTQHAEGIMLKRWQSPYRSGRVRGDWWKWKVEPFALDMVLTAAQRGHGKRASLYTDYTFAVWDGASLVTVAKAYSGLTDPEIRAVDAFVRANTLERYGPVRSVKPQLVFEIGFEGIQESKRHKAGLALRFPRILRARPDKPIEQADTLETLRDLLAKNQPT